MRYKIKECTIYGVRNPFLFLSGWIEKDIKLILIKQGNKVLYSEELNQTASKIKMINIKTPLNTTSLNFTVDFYAEKSDNTQHKIYTYSSNVVKRLKSKLFPSLDYDHFLYINKLNREIRNTMGATDIESYNQWIHKFEQFSEVEDFKYKPLISIVMPVYNVPGKYLSKCLNSILQQTYQNFEICIADDHSTNEDTIKTLKAYMVLDSRIKVMFREKNGHISEATNSALQLATGEFVGLMDNDDELMPQALNEVVRVINEQPDIDFIYSDEDKIDMKGRRSDPHFKADYAKDTFYGGNYICHFSVIRKNLIDQIGGFRKGYEGAQDFDLFLRLSEITNKFYHIQKILYHWRMIPGSTALDSNSKNYAGEAGKRALEDLLEKKKIPANVNIMINTHYFIEYLLDYQPVIDILINVKEVTDDFIDRINRMSVELEYKNFRFICFSLDHQNLFERLDKLNLEKEFFVIPLLSEKSSVQFNEYCKNSNAELFLFLNDMCEIQSFNALEIMAGYAKREDIGTVGVRMINENDWTLDTGYFVTNDKLLTLHKPSYSGDFGIYGNLLVPFNYRVVEHGCFMIEKKKFIAANGFDEDLSFRPAAYDLSMRVQGDSVRNVIIPYVEVQCYKFEEVSKEDEISVITKWKEEGINTSSDKYYNSNFSQDVTHRLPK